MRTFYLLVIMLAAIAATAQKSDTVRIDASKINTSSLIPGVHQYLVYFKNGKDSSRVNFQFWTREVQLTKHEGRDAITIKQTWEDNKSIIHRVNSINDRKTFAPLYHDSWWKSRGSFVFDFIKKTAFVNDKQVTAADTAVARQKMFAAYEKALTEYVLNWHLDLEVFPLLPYKDGVTFMINFYDPGFPAPSFQAYTVDGSAKLIGYGGQSIDCWLLKHESPNNHEVFWVSKKTREVLKLEQQFGTRYRYKVKLGSVAP
ncbi:MAG TPA: hypothetical protein VGD65_03990 [Chryseosolibacter sp.]